MSEDPVLKRIVVGTAAAALLALGSTPAFADTSWGGVAPAGATAPADTSRGSDVLADSYWGLAPADSYWGDAPADSHWGHATPADS
ncbi:hypothetical protein [Kitasatospora sp. NPDC059827]|uniref:hypothetical protein n=1 Tax=Kitasatospora sp. NPDC059827 TaxID=3346964 RepID=UPI003664DE97